MNHPNLKKKENYLTITLVINDNLNQYANLKSNLLELRDKISNLNELINRLIDAIYLIIKDKQHNLDRVTKEFRFNSDKFVSNQKFKLNQNMFLFLLLTFVFLFVDTLKDLMNILVYIH